jgi:uncharacterized protein
MIRSPCIAKCGLNENDICMGCGRTAVEIGLWIRYTDEQRLEIITRLQKDKLDAREQCD